MNSADFTTTTYPVSTGGFFTPKMGVRVTHIPTGLYAQCESGSSQHANKHKAWEQLVKFLENTNNSPKLDQFEKEYLNQIPDQFPAEAANPKLQKRYPEPKVIVSHGALTMALIALRINDTLCNEIADLLEGSINEV